MAEVKRILLVSSHSLFAEGVRSLLAGHAGFDIVGVVADAQAALRYITESPPDVVIVDEDGTIRGPDFVSLLDDNHDLRVVVVTLADDRVHLYRREQATQSGVDGLIEAIQRV